MMQSRSRQTGPGLAANQDRQVIARFPLSFHVSHLFPSSSIRIRTLVNHPLEGFLLHHVRLMIVDGSSVSSFLFLLSYLCSLGQELIRGYLADRQTVDMPPRCSRHGLDGRRSVIQPPSQHLAPLRPQSPSAEYVCTFVYIV
ncbi:hypothetical protein CGRA01v4_09646 [Colletotrichum graminicola]|nr:hypothetical protein CGRA01v4_09646 [Colletotrichum graminicola]